MALLSARPSTPPAGLPAKPAARPSAAQIRALLRTQITPRGKAGRIGALLKRGYALPLRALTARTAQVKWYRHRTLIASGRHSFAAAGSATVKITLTAAGRRQLKHAKRLALTGKGAFTPAPRPAGDGDARVHGQALRSSEKPASRRGH